MRLFLLSSFLLILASILPNKSYAQATSAPDIAPQPCDAEYWRQMQSRAWMEAQREIMQNQNLIFKPDSVLEYTCFDQFASVAAWDGGRIFTHSNYFGNMIIPRGSNESMEVAITNVVSNALNQYINNSFGHDFLGGRATFSSMADKDSQMVPATDRVGYTCNVMKNVWQTAKCSNFIDDAKFEDSDGFHPFKSLKDLSGEVVVSGYDDIQETRLFPENLSCRQGSGAQNFGPAGTWQDQINFADNINGYPYQEPLQQIFQDVYDRTAAVGTIKSNGSSVVCKNPPIRTGIMVYPDKGKPYEDGVCTNPGCKFDRTGICLTIGATPPVYDYDVGGPQ